LADVQRVNEERPWIRWVLIAIAALAWLAVYPPLSAYGVGRALGALGIAAVVRAVYRALANRWRPDRPFFVPSLFVLAATFALLGRVADFTERQNEARANAVKQGIVAEGDAATPTDLCVAGNLSDYDAAPAPGRYGLTRRQFRTFVERLCAQADRQDLLQSDGTTLQSDLTKLQDEAQAIIEQMRASGDL
jgi:hypothetical protein